eukprot:15479885-Alexandrium_andersonii.AAC.1
MPPSCFARIPTSGATRHVTRRRAKVPNQRCQWEMGRVWACFGRSVWWAGVGHALGGLRTPRTVAFKCRFGICEKN